MRVALVLRSGGIYRPWHAEVLAKQIEEHLPGANVLCLTDMAPDLRRISLVQNWPGWWSKMELFRPDVKGDLLYFDLDTLVLGSLSGIAAQCTRTLILRDFYRDGVRRVEGLQSSVMFLPEAVRAQVWEDWIADPRGWMVSHAQGGDQAFLERLWLGKVDVWQDVVPGQIVSYKVHCRTKVPETAHVICAHGRPKLWDLPEFKDYYAGKH